MSPEEFQTTIQEVMSRNTGSVEERIALATSLFTEYITSTDELPPSHLADRLLEWMDHDTFYSHNKRHMEYPIYTEAQLQHNDRRAGVKLSFEKDCRSTSTDDAVTGMAMHEVQDHAAELRRRANGQRKRKEGTSKRIQAAIDRNPGATHEEIARITHVSRMTVHRYLRGKSM